MGNFENRDRYKNYAEALEVYKKNIGWIVHLLLNDEGDFSIMGHINCEWCNYCEQQNIAYKAGLRYSDDYPLVHKAKENPYEEEK